MSAPQYPDAVDADLVGTYPASAGAGGGFVWDEVLEYRVWCHPERGAADLADGSDYYYAFATYAEALAFVAETEGAEAPLALIRQIEHIAEPHPGSYVHVREPRVTEWPVEFLARPRRNAHTIPDSFRPRPRRTGWTFCAASRRRPRLTTTLRSSPYPAGCFRMRDSLSGARQRWPR